MTVTRIYWQPQTQLNSLLQELERMSDRANAPISKHSQPRIETIESKQDFRVRVELPGIDGANIEVNASDRNLWIVSHRQRDRDWGRPLFTELHYGTFERKISFPEAIVNTQITADFADGILTVVLPKQSAQRPKTVKIHVPIDRSPEETPTSNLDRSPDESALGIDRLQTERKSTHIPAPSEQTEELTEDVWVA
ncbi:MAG: Hsp20/alpha crystallin family protein [Cyanobacteriota bacterium]|nr:Hsp20/alpha crystallin family protein [Cyanobacteriota bacterium]